MRLVILELSEARLRSADERHTLNTSGDFFYPDAHLRIDNETLSPTDAAERIVAFLESRATGG